MKKKFYQIGHNNMIVKHVWLCNDSYERKETYNTKEKATYVMLVRRLEKEKDNHRRKKLKIKINQILDIYPEFAI